MVLEMFSKSWESWDRWHMTGQLVPNVGCNWGKWFWRYHWGFPQRHRDGSGSKRSKRSWKIVSWENFSKVRRLLVVQHLEIVRPVFGGVDGLILLTFLDEKPHFEKTNKPLSRTRTSYDNASSLFIIYLQYVKTEAGWDWHGVECIVWERTWNCLASHFRAIPAIGTSATLHNGNSIGSNKLLTGKSIKKCGQ